MRKLLRKGLSEHTYQVLDIPRDWFLGTLLPFLSLSSNPLPSPPHLSCYRLSYLSCDASSDVEAMKQVKWPKNTFNGNEETLERHIPRPYAQDEVDSKCKNLRLFPSSLFFFLSLPSSRFVRLTSSFPWNAGRGVS